MTLLAALAAVSASAVEHPDQAVGFAAGGLQNLAIDNVSTYNGGLTVAVPVGPMFQLVYNSHIWKTTTVDGIYTQVFGNPRNTAGMGWRLHPGKLYAPNSWYGNETTDWVYVGPDGSSHNFHQQMHVGEDDGDGNVLYTRDGSYLRLQKVWAGTQWQKAVEFPDGTRHIFKPVPGWATNWELARIEDRFGNATTFTQEYPDGGWTTSRHLWTIVDPHGRTHRLNYGWRGGVLESVDYETVGGQRAVYQFVYQYIRHFIPYDTYPYNNARQRNSFLKKVIFPDGSELKMTKPDGSMAYLGSYIGWPTGVLSSVELPTGGRLEWDFIEWQFPTANPSDPQKGAGVTNRRMIRADGTVESEVVYDQSWVDVNGTWPPELTQTDVVYPTGHCTRHFFHQQRNVKIDGTNGWTGWDHGLSYRKDIVDGERYLSSEVWDGSSGTACSGTKLRSTYARYEHDKLPSTTHPAFQDEWFASNIRMKNQRIVYHDDGDRWVDTLNEDFDGVGHYRKTTVSGTLGRSLNDLKWTATTYNPTRGTYEVDVLWNTETANHTYVPMTPSDDWLLGLYDAVETHEPGAWGFQTTRDEFDFDPATGFLRAQRTLASGTTRGTKDILRIFTPTAEGQVATASLYGSDTNPLTTGPGWTPPATWSYRIETTYQFGAVKTSRAVKPDGTYWPYLATDVDLDPSTGKVLVSRDPTGLATTYTYDLLGRVTEVAPAEGAITRITYTNAAAGAPAIQTTVQYAADGTTELRRSEGWFDDFGRTWRDRKMVPDHGWVERETLYDASGAVFSVSAWGDFTKVTQTLARDAFGRPTHVRPAEGAAHDVTYTYLGDRQVHVQAYAATTETSEALVGRVTRSDSFGRLDHVLDMGLVAGLDQRTNYYYDADGNLGSITAIAADTSVVQARYFWYDHRGFLKQEKHPEKGPTGNGYVFYYDYDPSGKPGRMVDGPNHLGYSYDSLGRVLAVVDKNNADRPLKEYVYDTAPGRGAGKLAQATRHNYVTLPWDATETDAWVTDLYDYSGTAGAPSAKTTSFARGPYQYTSAYAYTDGGAIGSVTYPTCDAGFACPATPEPARTVSYTYEQGLLRQVPGWTNTITYHPTGAWSQMPRVNTVTDGRDSDPASPDRLNRFHASSPSTGASWDSGPMAYDGSGNLKSIGADTYTYDQSSRLLSGTAGGERQDYTYDAFGNITQIAHTDAGDTLTTRSIGVVPSTNRLSVATYDAAGNLTSWAGNTYTWDALGSLVQFNGGQNGGGTYLYDVEDRRVAVLKSPDNTAAAKDETYIVRSLAGQTLREFTVTGPTSPATRAWSKDYLYAAGNLLASVKTDGAGGEDIRHYHRDHLGSPRLITDASGSEVGRRTYLPYGEMVTDTASDETHKYTLHERDENFAGTDDDLDYMLARYYSPHLGRFLSCDPERGRAERLQTLNRYAYAWGNPVKNVDPDGRDPCTVEVVERYTDDEGNVVGTSKGTATDWACVEALRREEELRNLCSDPVFSRLNPECTGQDSGRELHELNPGAELEHYENKSQKLAELMAQPLDCVRQATRMGKGREPGLLAWVTPEAVRFHSFWGGFGEITGDEWAAQIQYAQDKLGAQNWLLAAHGHPSKQAEYSAADQKVANYFFELGMFFYSAAEGGVGDAFGRTFSWASLNVHSSTPRKACVENKMIPK